MLENDWLLWFFLLTLIFLLILPTIRHLYSGWKHRRDSVLNSFADAAKEAYFKAFQPGLVSNEPASSRFRRYYDERFGRQHFILPLVLLFLIAGILVFWSGFSIRSWLSSGALDAFIKHRLSLFSVIAIAGAYLYCISDQIRRWYTLDLCPADLYWLSFRFVAAIPLGWALRYFVAQNLAIPACFFVAAFPTNTLFALMRRLLSQTVKLGDIPMSGETQLKALAGIDVLNAERFAAEDITTIAQLAYSDPVELTMRTNFDYSYIVDCLSQALLFIYVDEDYLHKLTLHGIRGSYEMRVICLDLDSHEHLVVDAAKEKLRAVASAIDYPSAEALEAVVHESGCDPCTVFIYESWMSAKEELGSRSA